MYRVNIKAVKRLRLEGKEDMGLKKWLHLPFLTAVMYLLQWKGTKKTQQMEKVHTGKSLGNRVQVSESSPSGVTQDAVNSSNRWV